MRGKSLRNLALVVALGICLIALPVACAEGEEAAPAVEAPAPAPEATPAPVEEAAPAPAEEPVENGEAAPAEEAPSAGPTEEPAGDGEAAPAEGAPAGQETVGNDDPVPAAGTIDEVVPVTGSVSVELVNEGTVYFGDRVTLRANISNVNAAFRIRWEVNCRDNDGWRVIPNEQGSEYEFVVTPDNVNYEYRVVLVIEA